jgi:hypothetical protein
VLVDAAPSRGGDDYIRLDLARDMRHESALGQGQKSRWSLRHAMLSSAWHGETELTRIQTDGC